MKVNEFVTKLVETHGIDKAKQIVQDNLTIVLRAEGATFYDEVDWNIDCNGTLPKYSYPKSEGKKTAGVKARRVKSSRNFYTAASQLLNKKVA